MHGLEYRVQIPLDSPQYSPPPPFPYHNIPWLGCPFSREHSSTAEKEPGLPRFFSVVHLVTAFRRAVKKKKEQSQSHIFLIKIDKYDIVKMCNKKLF